MPVILALQEARQKKNHMFKPSSGQLNKILSQNKKLKNAEDIASVKALSSILSTTKINK